MVLTKDLIKKSEEKAVESGIFSFSELMKNAGDEAYKIISENFDINSKKIAVFSGTGNNGGDGFVIAKNLLNNGALVSVFEPLGPAKTETAAFYEKEITISDYENIDLNSFDIIIDALFGIGLNKSLNENAIKLINEINNSRAIKISIDIPSGIECDTGKILPVCINADLCITFIALKPCFMLPPASDFVKKVIVADIRVTPEAAAFEINKEPIFYKRPHNSHKGTFGTASLLCGSYGMAGAAILAAKASLRSGVGIAKCVCLKSIYPILTKAVPEAVCVPVSKGLFGGFSSFINLEKILKNSNALLFGPGIGTYKNNLRVLKKLLKTSKIPLLIDADGINLLSGHIELLRTTKADIILTPHPKEMARLIGKTVRYVEENRIETAREFAKKFNCVLVLKGANTIIADKNGNITFNINGNPGMATGGSGDVLSGIIVSLLAQGYSPLDAAKMGVFLHSDAGDKAASLKGERQMLPSDIIDML